MDDSEHVCPICCEDLDISDQQFFPCKCGYQVCMWCWHRIKESESGLCPACRTPYGNDPHAFSAVDVDEVLKAKKEKDAAAKRERDRLRHSENGHGTDAETIAALSNGKAGQMEIPRDRSMLANMRVIRRNLVYAVGLATNIASEDMLRRPDYFGQYGRISKIVLNRSQTTATGDTRRASASAYVTFAHKEDTLSCILALDGFYIDGRNIRASYGTSKYCSAFIKNVRCNNPDCTYLHEMGDIEDTFTKQEIQAGYVTSGRDVLARQQQIMKQALASVSGNGSTPRKKVGGGGPSGTGRASSSPVFPPPTFDEPHKPQLALVPPPPSSASVARSSTSGAAFPPISGSGHAASNAAMTPSVASAKLARSSSTGANASVASAVSIATGSAAIPSAAPAVASRKSAASLTLGAPEPANSNTLVPPPGATVASVVAGVHSSKPAGASAPSAHSALTQLTPLKRTSTAKSTTKAQSNEQDTATTTKLASLRTSTHKKKDAARNAAASVAKAASNSAGKNSSNGSASANGSANANANLTTNAAAGIAQSNSNGARQVKPPAANNAPALIGGTVIAATSVSVPSMAATNGVNARQGAPITAPPPMKPEDGLGGLGGEVFTGTLKSNVNPPSIGAAGGSAKDKWNGVPIGNDPVFPPPSSAYLWPNGQAIGSGGVNLAPTPGGFNGFAGAPMNNGSGSSALASMLGINLPTGSGSLRGSTDSWAGFSPNPKPSPLTALNATSVPVQALNGSTIVPSRNNGLIGGVTIGTPSPMTGSAALGVGSGKSDIALLQSLLPGVHITSGGSNRSAFGTIGGGTMAGNGGGGGGGWNGLQHPIQPSAPGGIRAPGGGLPGAQWNGTNNPSAIGAIGQPTMKHHQQPQQQPQPQRHAHGAIW